MKASFCARRRWKQIAMAAVVPVLGAAPIAGAGTAYWDINGNLAGAGGAAPAGAWESSFWSSDSSGASATSAWTSGDSAVFSASNDANGSFSVSLGSPQTANDLTFEEGIPTLTGSALTLTTGNITTPRSGQLNGVIQLELQGTSGLTKLGNGTLNLATAANYTGATTISSGILQYTASNLLPDSSDVSISSGQIQMSTFSDTVKSLAINGGAIAGSTGVLTAGAFTATGGTINVKLAGATASLTKTTAGALSIQQATNYGGGTFINGGAITINAPGAFSDTGPITISNGAELQMGTSDTVGAFTLINGTVSSPGALSAGSFDLRSGTITGNLAGSGAVSKTTTGTVNLNSANSFTSVATISAGTVMLNNGSGLGASGAGSATTINTGAMVQVAQNVSVPESFTINGTGISNQGALSSFNGNNTFTGAISLGSDAKIAAGNSGSVTFSGGIATNGHTLTWGGTTFNDFWINTNGITGTGGVTTLNVATLRYTTACNYTGETTLNGGQLLIMTTNALPATAHVTVNSGEFGLLFAQSITGATLISGQISSSFVPAATRTLTVSDSLDVRSGTITAPIAGAASITKTTTGSVSIFATVPSTYTGVTNINAGTLGYPAGLPTAGGNMTVATGATLSGAGTMSRNIINNGTVTGAPSIFGTVLQLAGITSGPGNFTGPIEIAGTLAPGASPAAITMEDVTFDPTATLAMELGGVNLGTAYDHITFNTATFGGTLTVTTINSFTPGSGQTFDLFDGALSGSFANVNLPPLPSGMAWDTSDLYSGGSIAVGVPEPATLAVLSLALTTLATPRRQRRLNTRA